MWSEATERLRERYHSSYGFTQGVWVSMLVAWVVMGLAPGWVVMVLSAIGVGSSLSWRHSWRKYRTAFRAEADASVAAAKAELEKWTAELEALRAEKQ